MRILALDQFSDLGGAQRCLLDLAPWLLRARWQLHVLLPGHGPLAESLRALGIPVQFVACGPYSHGRKTLRDLGRFLVDYRALLPSIRAAVETHAPDLIYVNGPRLLPAAARACGNTPILFHSHSYLSKQYAVSLIGRELKRTGAAVIASSRFAAKAWQRHAAVSTVYNGTPEIPFRPKPAPPNRPWRIGVIGRIAPEKGQLEFVQAARLVLQAGICAEFHIHGAPLWSSGTYLNRVRAAARGVDVRFNGWANSVDTILHELDIVVVPSPLHESTTRVILESFSAGAPIVAFPSGGIPEVVEHRRTGFLTSSISPHGLAAEIQEVIEHPEVLTEVAISARQEWEKRFTLGRYVADVMEAMELAARRTNGNKQAAVTMTAAATLNTRP